MSVRASTSAGLRSRSGADRKSTRLNSSHQIISYAVFCLKKKNTQATHLATRPRRPPATPSAAIRASPQYPQLVCARRPPAGQDVLLCRLFFFFFKRRGPPAFPPSSPPPPFSP